MRTLSRRNDGSARTALMMGAVALLVTISCGYTILTGLVLTTARLEDHHAGKRATWLGFNWRGLSDGGAHMSHPPLQSPDVRTPSQNASSKILRSELPLVADEVPARGPRQHNLVGNGVLLRTGGLTSEGYGSFFQRIKSSIIFATLLNKTLVISEHIQSEHNYSVTANINEISGNFTRGPACNLQLHGDEHALLDSACQILYGNNDIVHDAMPFANLTSWLTAFEANNSCIDLQQTKVPEPGFVETYEGFNDCIQPWLSATFHKLFEHRAYKVPSTWQVGCIHVGIHIRWGDVATSDTSQLDPRSMQQSEINTVVDTLKKTGKNFEFHVFVKNPSDQLLSGLNFSHTITNDEDDLYDIYLYTQMDMQGESSFSAMASLINPNKTVITNKPSSNKYKFDYQQVNFVYDFNNESYVGRVQS